MKKIVDDENTAYHPRSVSLSLGGQKYVSDDRWQKLLINERYIPLTPTEYRIMTYFLENAFYFECMCGNKKIALLSCKQERLLQSQVSISSKRLLQKHISQTNSKIAPFGLTITPLSPFGMRERGYLLIALQ